MPFLIPVLLGGVGLAGFTLGFGTSKSTDKLFNYALVGGVLFLGYTVLKKGK